MQFPFISSAFWCDKSASNAIEHLIYILQNDSDMNAKIIHISQNELSFYARPTYILEKNAFLPRVHIVMSDVGNSSSGTVNYSLQKGTKALLVIYVALLLAFECVLIYLSRQLESPLLLLIPIILIIFAAVMSICGLFVMSKRIHHTVLGPINAFETNQLRVVFLGDRGDSSKPQKS